MAPSPLYAALFLFITVTRFYPGRLFQGVDFNAQNMLFRKGIEK